MSYLGNQPAIGKFTLCDDLTPDGSTTTFSLTSSSNAVVPGSVNAMLVSINGVIQAPSTYTINGSQIIFSTAPGSGDVIDQIRVFGSVLNVGTVSDGTITTAKIIDSAVTTVKLNDASVSLAKLTATGTKDATTFLRGDNTFAGAGITMADQWRRTAAMTITSSAQVLSANWEQVDTSGQGTIGSSMTQSSGIFTFPSTGLYFILVNQGFADNSSDSRYFEFKIEGTLDNSSYALQSRMTSSLKHISSYTYSMLTCNTFFNVTNTSLCKIRFTAESANNTTIGGDTAFNESQSYTFIRLGDSV